MELSEQTSHAAFDVMNIRWVCVNIYKNNAHVINPYNGQREITIYVTVRMVLDLVQNHDQYALLTLF